jgi:hypothetical protein
MAKELESRGLERGGASLGFALGVPADGLSRTRALAFRASGDIAWHLRHTPAKISIVPLLVLYWWWLFAL